MHIMDVGWHWVDLIYLSGFLSNVFRILQTLQTLTLINHLISIEAMSTSTLNSKSFLSNHSFVDRFKEKVYCLIRCVLYKCVLGYNSLCEHLMFEMMLWKLLTYHPTNLKYGHDSQGFLKDFEYLLNISNTIIYYHVRVCNSGKFSSFIYFAQNSGCIVRGTNLILKFSQQRAGII